MTRRGWRMWAGAKCDGQTDRQTRIIIYRRISKKHDVTIGLVKNVT